MVTPARILIATPVLLVAACDLGQVEEEVPVGNKVVEIERDAQSGAVEEVEIEDRWYDWGYDASWEEWDVDRDFELSYEEYQTGWNRVGLFRAWDANDDGRLSDVEVGSGLFDDWDVDSDQQLRPDEFRWGLRGWSKSDAVSWGRFATWDADNNRLISRSEFLAQWDQLTVYDEWAVDDDPELGEEEFARGVYATWDSNGDGVVDMIEYRF